MSDMLACDKLIVGNLTAINSRHQILNNLISGQLRNRLCKLAAHNPSNLAGTLGTGVVTTTFRKQCLAPCNVDQPHAYA